MHVLPCNPAPVYSLSGPPKEPSVPPSASICCLGWGVNLTDGRGVERTANESHKGLAVEDTLTPESTMSKLPYIKADLPRQLALLDIDRSLPKLSTLPSTGDEYVLSCLLLQGQWCIFGRESKLISLVVMIYSAPACRSIRYFIPIIKTPTPSM